MKYRDDDYTPHPVKDFAMHSPALQNINWTPSGMINLIKTKVALDGHKDNTGKYYTTKYAIMQALKMRNEGGFALKINLEEAYRQIHYDCVPIY